MAVLLLARSHCSERHTADKKKSPAEKMPGREFPYDGAIVDQPGVESVLPAEDIPKKKKALSFLFGQGQGDRMRSDHERARGSPRTADLKHTYTVSGSFH
jgi:hypothetical protein